MKCKIRGCSSSTLLNVVVKTTFHTIPSVKKDPHRHAIWKRFIDLEVRNGITEKCFETGKKCGKMYTTGSADLYWCISDEHFFMI